MIQLQNIRKTYQTKEGEVPALAGVSLSVARGEFVSIVGPSGCGKSTLLNIMAGLEKQDGGQVFIEGKEQSGVSAAVGYMPQKDELFPWRSIWGNVTLGLAIQRKKDAAAEAHARELLERYGLGEFLAKTPRQLSGGMRQRCALIRTLAADPKILLLDEPFSALDYQTRLRVSDDIAHIIRSEGKTAVLVTHDISESICLSDRVFVLSARPGRVKSVRDLAEFRGVAPQERREHPDFSVAFRDIWKELENGA